MRQGFSMKTAIMDNPFELQQLKLVAEFSDALFPSCLQAIVSIVHQIQQQGSWQGF